ncbi:MAG: hypothetical protein ETSY2_55290 [Candidatus Entotheonella gemina]|uniref:Uncharacterized protein n=1 Tax=Candidatus Entotheonella gemina TaxID=1429439 RepID=W4L3N6_9BACT|nr:MAG: hypothetical protein ETSY2_55290 [Candidatus Entotheonella gemina]
MPVFWTLSASAFIELAMSVGAGSPSCWGKEREGEGRKIVSGV